MWYVCFKFSNGGVLLDKVIGKPYNTEYDAVFVDYQIHRLTKISDRGIPSNLVNAVKFYL